LIQRSEGATGRQHELRTLADVGLEHTMPGFKRKMAVYPICVRAPCHCDWLWSFDVRI